MRPTEDAEVAFTAKFDPTKPGCTALRSTRCRPIGSRSSRVTHVGELGRAAHVESLVSPVRPFEIGRSRDLCARSCDRWRRRFTTRARGRCGAASPAGWSTGSGSVVTLICILSLPSFGRSARAQHSPHCFSETSSCRRARRNALPNVAHSTRTRLGSRRGDARRCAPLPSVFTSFPSPPPRPLVGCAAA